MARTRISLDGPWEFFVDPEERLSADSLAAAGQPRTIAVPGPWQAQFDDLRSYAGVAWYRRGFEAPAGASRSAWPSPTSPRRTCATVA